MGIFGKSTLDYLIAGLGNPGPKYDGTRHNAGFRALDAVAKEFGIEVAKRKFQGLMGQGEIAGKRCLLLKPQTFMNLSGESVEAACQYYKIPYDKVIILFDDISLEPGQLRIRRKGTHGGHNGVRSIIECTGSEEFPRVKLGVGKKPHPDYDLAAWVLGKFTPEQNKAMEDAIGHCPEIVQLMVQGKIDQAMNRYNR